MATNKYLFVWDSLEARFKEKYCVVPVNSNFRPDDWLQLDGIIASDYYEIKVRTMKKKYFQPHYRIETMEAARFSDIEKSYPDVPAPM